MATLTMTAADISCEHCRTTIERALGEMPGIQTVSVDLADKVVQVTYDPLAVTPAQIEEKLDEEGYPVQ